MAKCNIFILQREHWIKKQPIAKGYNVMMRKELENIIEYFEKREEVVALFLFGSFDTPIEKLESDIDIAVLISPKEAERDVLEKYRNEYYSASPYFSLKPVDIVLLNKASVPLKFEILKTARVLFEKEPSFKHSFVLSTIQEYFEYKHLENIYFNAVKRRLREKHGQSIHTAKKD